MARYAMVDDPSGIVVNVIEWDGSTDTWRPPSGYSMVEDVNSAAAPGFQYQNGEFIPPPGGEPGGIGDDQLA